MRILLTGAGSVMGQSIYKALAQHHFSEPIDMHVGNSDELGAAFYFTAPSLPIVARAILPLAQETHYSEILSKYVRDHAIDIVFAGTQHELTKISRLTSEGIKCATLPSSVADLCLDKARCITVLAARGIRVPRTQTLPDFISRPLFSGPGIIKPNKSSASRGLLFFDDVSGITTNEIAVRRDGDFVVQNRLSGDEFTCGCYVDRFSREMNVILLRRKLTLDGATSFGEIVHDLFIEAYVRSVAEALAHEGFDFGHINVQLIVDSNGPCLFEVNGRLSSTEAPKAKFGFNSSAAYVVNLVENAPYSGFAVAPAGKFLRYYDEVYWT